MSRCGLLGWMVDLALLLNRLALGGYFILAGYGKIAAQGGANAFFSQTFSPMVPLWARNEAWKPFLDFYGHAIPYAEMTVGILLVLGMLGRLAGLVQCAMLVSFTLALYAAGKFSAGPGPFHPNIIFITLSFLLVFAGMGRFSIDRLLFGRACHRRTDPLPTDQTTRSHVVTPPPPSARPQPRPFQPTNDEP